ncbi:unnamed protein product, partial [Prorocentrum cordatum]
MTIAYTATDGDASASADEGIPRMTPKVLEECCLKNRGFSLPELNDVLILSYRGFRRIEGLNPYTNIKSLFLDSNGIRKIENLQGLPGLTSLYLQQNCIERIENLDCLTSLKLLNLSQNSITSVENLAALRELETIKLSGNKIVDVEALHGLRERPTLRCVDVSQNYIEDGDGLLDFFSSALPEVESVAIHHNVCSRALKDGRRRLVSSLASLRWLDERPVTAVERAGCEAWATGGKDAELAAKTAHWQREKEDKERSFQNFRRVQQAAAERARAQREAQAARDAARERAAAGLQETGALTEGFVAIPAVPAAAKHCQAEGSSRQHEIRARVQALLTGDDPPTGDLAPPEGDSDSPAQRSTTPAEQQDVAPGAGTDAAAASGAAEDAGHSASGPPAAADDVDPGPFEWTPFRDKRLGQLVAENRYNFDKAAALLGAEFGHPVAAPACRERYGELLRPRPAAAGQEAARRAPDREQAAGRAKDAPEPRPEALKEVSDWWLRRLSAGAAREARRAPPPARPAGPPPAEDAEAEAGADASAALAAGSPAGRGSAGAWQGLLSAEAEGPSAAPAAPAAGGLAGRGSAGAWQSLLSAPAPAEGAAREGGAAAGFLPPPRGGQEVPASEWHAAPAK